ncbi:Patatin-like phospholipase family protein [Cryptosporidium felis]|nr:Patatin-like phospholipase family protein [Cryptosporidium felis]
MLGEGLDFWESKIEGGAGYLGFFVEAIPLPVSEQLSTEQCRFVVEEIEKQTLGYLFKNGRDVCKSSENFSKAWKKKFLNSAQPPYLEFHNRVRPSKMNLEMEFLAKSNRSAMLGSLGTGDDHSKCFVLGFAGYGNRGMWSAAVAKGLAAQFSDQNVPLRWDVVAGISSGGFNALASIFFTPGGDRGPKTASDSSSSSSTPNPFLFKSSESRNDAYICSNGNKDVKFEIWFAFSNGGAQSKCYSNPKEVDLEEIRLSGSLPGVANELSYTSFLYEMYMRGSPKVINNGCFIPTSQDSTKWWSTILLTFANFGKKPISSFCTMSGWQKFYKESFLKLATFRREALLSASRLFDGTLIHWSSQFILTQILQKNESHSWNSSWVQLSEDDASTMADIATASNAVSGVYLPVKVNNDYFVWGGLRGESNLEAAVERCKEIKPGIKEEDIIIDFITGSYYREELFLAGSYVELLGKENYFGKLFRRIKNYIHHTNAYARPDPPQLFELFNRAWEFITAPSRGMFPIKSLKRRYPRVKLRFVLRPNTLRFFPKSSYVFPEYKDKVLIMTDGYLTGYKAVVVDSDSIETNNSV